MPTIWKYLIPIKDSFSLKIPSDYRILDFKIQDGNPVLWVSVILENSNEDVKFRVFATGVSLPTSSENLHYIGTVLMINDSLAWHLFRET